jgi:hypothetical protein
MLYRNILVYMAISVAAGVIPALASAHARHAVDSAPLAAHAGIVPVAGAGYAWEPGYRIWSGHEYVWVGSDYNRSRRGHHWDVDSRNQDFDRWRHERVRWDHD